MSTIIRDEPSEYNWYLRCTTGVWEYPWTSAVGETRLLLSNDKKIATAKAQQITAIYNTTFGTEFCKIIPSPINADTCHLQIVEEQAREVIIRALFADAWRKHPLIEACENNLSSIALEFIGKGALKELSTKACEKLLFTTIRRGLVDVLQVLLKSGVSPRLQDEDGNTPLHVACSQDGERLVRMLLLHGADIRTKNKKGETVFHIAAEKSSWEIMGMLLASSGSDMLINEGDSNGFTALIIAACRRNFAFIERLLATPGINIDKSNRWGRTPFLQACLKNTEDVVELFIKRGANTLAVDYDEKTALHLICENKNTAVAVKLLTTTRIPINAQDNKGHTVLTQACVHKDQALVSLLLSHKASTSLTLKDGTNALHIVCQNDTLSIVKSLLNATHTSPDIIHARDEDGMTALLCALKGSYFVPAVNIDLVNFLIDRGADVMAKNRRGCTALHFACERDNVLILKKIIESLGSHCRTLINSQTVSEGETPLMRACITRSEAVAGQLLLLGADPRLANSNKNTSLHLALERNLFPIARKLVALSDVDVNVQNLRGETPFFLACVHGYEDLIECCARRGANPFLVDIQGNTALHAILSSSGFSSDRSVIARKLIDLLASNLNIQNLRGETPFFIAASRGNEELLALLVDRGAHPAIPDNEGDTALHQASQNNALPIVHKLLKLLPKTAIDLCNKRGKTALLCAIQYRHSEVQAILATHGASVRYAQEYLLRVQLAHIWGIGGFSELVLEGRGKQVIPLEGYSQENQFPLFLKYVKSFFEAKVPEVLLLKPSFEKILRALTTSFPCSHKAFDAIDSKIRSGTPHVIFAGTHSHRIPIVIDFSQKLLIIGNRGERTTGSAGIRIYRVPELSMTTSMVEKWHTFYGTIEAFEKVVGESHLALQNEMVLEEQECGNCSWVAHELAFLMLIICEGSLLSLSKEKEKVLYTKFLAHVRGENLKEYRSISSDYDLAILSKIDVKRGLKSMSKIDSRDDLLEMGMLAKALPDLEDPFNKIPQRPMDGADYVLEAGRWVRVGDGTGWGL